MDFSKYYVHFPNLKAVIPVKVACAHQLWSVSKCLRFPSISRTAIVSNRLLTILQSKITQDRFNWLIKLLIFSCWLKIIKYVGLIAARSTSWLRSPKVRYDVSIILKLTLVKISRIYTLIGKYIPCPSRKRTVRWRLTLQLSLENKKGKLQKACEDLIATINKLISLRKYPWFRLKEKSEILYWNDKGKRSDQQQPTALNSS